MKILKILNLYCGIGGNRKLLGNDHEITAIENNPEIAKIYQDFFPKDKVIVADAHQYLLEHYKEFDFIWSSPPCPTHSRMRFLLNEKENVKPVYPDMKLYEEILLLRYWFKGKYVVENVISYYEPLLSPQTCDNHYFWSNFYINPLPNETRGTIRMDNKFVETRTGFNLDNCDTSGLSKRKLLNNCVIPETGLHIFQEAFREYKTLL